jgi:hypothetical protein
MSRDTIVSQHSVWSWGQKLHKASLNTPLEEEQSPPKRFFLKHNGIINKSISCGTTSFRFNSEGVAEFKSENYNDAIKMTQFSDCSIFEKEA